MANQTFSIATKSTQSSTMSSRDIAELTEKDHSHVMRDIRAMLDVLKKDASSFGGIYLDAYGREKPCFNLDRELTMTLVSGYDVPLRHRVVTRLAELEAQQAAPKFDPSKLTTMQILELAMRSESERLELAAKVEVMAPKVAALDRIKTADGMLNLQAAGKLLQQQPNKFIQWLREHGWIYKRAGSKTNSARAEKFNVGYLATKISTTIHADGTERIHEQVMITPKGLAKLAGIFAMPSPEF